MKISITDMMYNFYLIKGHIHYFENIDVINSYVDSPGLINIAEKHKIDVVQVYNIMREYRLDELNKSVIIANEGNI